MVKFTGTGPKGPVIGLGLSKINLRMLKEGKPIVVNLAELNLPPGEILIWYGETEQALARVILPHINEDTIVYGTETLEK